MSLNCDVFQGLSLFVNVCCILCLCKIMFYVDQLFGYLWVQVLITFLNVPLNLYIFVNLHKIENTFRIQIWVRPTLNLREEELE